MRASKPLLVFLVLSLSFALAPAVFAEEPPPDFARPGGYVALGGNYGLQDFGGPGGRKGRNGDGAGLDARLGRRVNKWFGVEFFFDWTTNFSVSAPAKVQTSFPVKPTNTKIQDIETYLYGISGKFYPLHGRVQPYVVAGMGGLTSSSNIPGSIAAANGLSSSSQVDTGFIGRAGLGLDVYITENFVVEIEGTYVMPTGPVNDLWFALLGGNLQYRF